MLIRCPRDPRKNPRGAATSLRVKPDKLANDMPVEAADINAVVLRDNVTDKDDWGATCFGGSMLDIYSVWGQFTGVYHYRTLVLAHWRKCWRDGYTCVSKVCHWKKTTRPGSLFVIRL